MSQFEKQSTAKSHTRNVQHTRREKVTDLTQLHPGDHISFYRSDFSYSHHGIVRDARKNFLLLIHYFNTAENAWNSLIKGSLYLAEVIESEWDVNLESTTEEIYVHHYDHINCYSNAETLERAIKNLGRRGYSLLNNNCEHWARWCRTGESYSEQVTEFCQYMKDKAGTLFIVDPGALLVKDFAMVGTECLGTFLSAVGSGVILTAVETISTVMDVKRKLDQRRQGSLSEVAFKKFVVRRMTSASGTVMGGIAGTIIGTILIPVPVVGSMIGGVIGTVGGKILGGISGIAISKAVEVYHKQQRESVEDTEIVSELMHNLLRHNEKLFEGLMTYAYEPDREAEIENIVKQATTTTNSPLSSTLYPLFEQLIRQYSMLTDEECFFATQLTGNIDVASNDSEYFILTPVPDENAPEQFASTVDLLVLRWPHGKAQPWNSSEGEQVLNITDLDTENKSIE